MEGAHVAATELDTQTPASSSDAFKDVFDIMRQAGAEHDEIHRLGGGPGVWPKQEESH
ncbi:hypothetical protein AB0D27_37110 [Streptomyces sp. NPDC048415]|uniref:hypothetical protein n=1 Tax=Streptomyces sp. NPDC048415 TaxID=3154822 RepID=UPI003423C131